MTMNITEKQVLAIFKYVFKNIFSFKKQFPQNTCPFHHYPGRQGVLHQPLSLYHGCVPVLFVLKVEIHAMNSIRTGNQSYALSDLCK